MATSPHPGFSTKIDLGKKPNEAEPPAPTNGEKNPKTYYPSIYLSDIPGLEQIPAKGTALIDFKRNSVTISTPKDGKKRVSVELEAHAIHLPPHAEPDGDEDIGTGMKKMAQKMGVNLGTDAEPDGDEETEGADGDEKD